MVFLKPDENILYIRLDERLTSVEQGFEAYLLRPRFTVVNAHGGIKILVAHEPRATFASCWLDSPHSVKDWLRSSFWLTG